MPTYAELAQQACDAYLETLSQTQEATLKAVAAFAAHTPRTPNPEVLLTASCMMPSEAAAETFSFARKLVANQRAYATRLLAITEESSRNGDAAPSSDDDSSLRVVQSLRRA